MSSSIAKEKTMTLVVVDTLDTFRFYSKNSDPIWKYLGQFSIRSKFLIAFTKCYTITLKATVNEGANIQQKLKILIKLKPDLFYESLRVLPLIY